MNYYIACDEYGKPYSWARPTMDSKKKSEIWIVVGSSGEYDDAKTWVVCGYKLYENASKFCEEANRIAKELDEKYATPPFNYLKKLKHSLDQHYIPSIYKDTKYQPVKVQIEDTE